MTVYEIALHLQQDLIESREKPTKVRKSAESMFIQKVLGAWGYELSRQKLRRLWEDNELTLRAATDYEGTIHANSGIAMIVPISQLKDLLYSPKVQQGRDNLFANQPNAQ